MDEFEFMLVEKGSPLPKKTTVDAKKGGKTPPLKLLTNPITKTMVR